jgi:protein-L-isoaspartate(D-aspartate) O-methyltransferase
MDAAARRREMVRTLVETGTVRDPRLAAALDAVPRHLFVPPEQQDDAYLDAPLAIGAGQTISAPHMVAIMAEALNVQPGHRVLEVGAGSGYHAAVLAKLASPGGWVLSTERIEALAQAARANIARLEESLPVDVRVADGSAGFLDLAPYDRISVAAAAPLVPPPLVEQLAPGGWLVVPVGQPDSQFLLRLRKDAAGSVTTENLGGCRFVPLVGAYGWPG